MTRTVENRFSNWTGLHKGADGKVRESATYAYESTMAFYEISVIEGHMFVSTNCGPLSNLICDWKPHHYAIADHFGLS